MGNNIYIKWGSVYVDEGGDVSYPDFDYEGYQDIVSLDGFPTLGHIRINSYRRDVLRYVSKSFGIPNPLQVIRPTDREFESFLRLQDKHLNEFELYFDTAVLWLSTIQGIDKFCKNKDVRKSELELFINTLNEFLSFLNFLFRSRDKDNLCIYYW